MKKLIMSLVVMALVGGLVGGGLIASFSDTETSNDNTFTAGTLDLKLSNSPDFTDGVTATWESPTDWAPGDTESATLRMKNDGSVGSYFLYLKPTVLVEEDFDDTSEAELPADVDDIANWINITNFQVTYRDTTTNDAFLEYGNWAGDTGWMTTYEWGPWSEEAPLTLREFQQTVWWVIVWGSPRASDDVLEADGENIIELEMTLEFEPTAPNAYQGDRCTMVFEVATGNDYPLVLHEVWHGSEGYGYASLE